MYRDLASALTDDSKGASAGSQAITLKSQSEQHRQRRRYHSCPSSSSQWYLIDIAISAIVIAIQMITKHCKKLKWKRKIVLVTDGRGTLDADPEGISEISKKIKADEMELVVV